MSRIFVKRIPAAWCTGLLLAAACGGKLTVDTDGIHGGETGGAGSGGLSEGGVAPTSGGVGEAGAAGEGGATGTGGFATGGGAGASTASGGSSKDGGVGGAATGGMASTGGTSGGGAATGGFISPGGTAGTGGSASGGVFGTGGSASGGVFGTGGGTGAADAGHCFDGKRDSTESDVDCGGECAGCGPGQVCYFDGDCSATAPGCDQCYCDVFTSTCVYNHCYDHKKDAGETDVDCGGGTCKPCANGLACLGDADCAYQACDYYLLVCSNNQCADRRLDGQESDIDCGGGTCSACTFGMKCNNNLDCVAGNVCSAMKVCQ